MVMSAGITADLHMHSSTSFDARDDIIAMCEACIGAGLDTACFTEHHDLYSEKHWLDIGAHNEAITRAQEAYPELTVLKGIEAGYSREMVGKLRDDIALLGPDYVLLSVHAVNGIDPYHAEQYYSGRTRLEGMRAYLQMVREAMSALQDWDALAHIGYAGRYAPPGETATPLRYSDAPDLLDDILKELVALGRALEVNTSQTGKGGDTIPGEDILARYRELGGGAVVLGSDAHGVDGVAAGFAGARDMLLRLGFRAYRVYEGRVYEERKL